MLVAKGLFRSQDGLVSGETSTTRSEYLACFRSFLDQCDDGLHFIYFAGHAAVCNGGLHLAFFDTRKSVLSETSVAINQLLKWAAYSPGKFVFILDCCRNSTGHVDFEYCPSNCSIIYTTSLGQFRYEEFSISRSFPALFERALRYLGDEFRLSELCAQLNTRRINPSWSEQQGVEFLSDVTIPKSVFSIDRSILEATDLVACSLLTSANFELPCADFRSKNRRRFESISDRYSAAIDLKEIDAVRKGFFSVEVAAPKQLLAPLLKEISAIAPGVLMSLILPKSVDFNALAKEGYLKSLPGEVPGGGFFWYEGQALMVKVTSSSTVLTPMNGVAECGLFSGQSIFKMCERLRLF